MKIVVLGDCQSNGNNCLADEIMQNSELRTWSMRHNKQLAQVTRWMLSQRKKDAASDMVELKNLEDHVWKYLREQEMKLAWPAMIKAQVVNLSYNGAHFSGHWYRLAEFLQKDRPNHIIITDYQINHVGVVFRYQGKQYSFEGTNYNESAYHGQYPLAVHELRMRNMERNKRQTHDWTMRKHRRCYQGLTALIESYQIPYSLMKFGNVTGAAQAPFDQFMPTQIDCTNMYGSYTVADGEWSHKKRICQSKIADLVNSYLDLH